MNCWSSWMPVTIDVLELLMRKVQNALLIVFALVLLVIVLLVILISILFPVYNLATKVFLCLTSNRVKVYCNWFDFMLSVKNFQLLNLFFVIAPCFCQTVSLGIHCSYGLWQLTAVDGDASVPNPIVVDSWNCFGILVYNHSDSSATPCQRRRAAQNLMWASPQLNHISINWSSDNIVVMGQRQIWMKMELFCGVPML